MNGSALYEDGQQSSPGTRTGRRWCGLRPRVALAVAMLAALIIIAAVVCGVVEGLASLGKTNTSDSESSNDGTVLSSATAPDSATPTSTTSTSTSVALPTPSNGILPLNCPAINNTQYMSGGQSFYIYCQVDLKSGSGNMAPSSQLSIGACIDACTEHNANPDTSNSPCHGLTFGANLTRYASVHFPTGMGM